MITIKNQADSNVADLYINGTIVDDDEGNWLKFWEESDGYQWPADLKRQLDELKDKDLNIYINSYGGSIAAGLAMAHMIERHKGKTTAVIDGYCCSIATQIFFSADVRKMPSNSYLMIHKPWGSVVGDANELRKTAEILDTLQRGIETTYCKHVKDSVTADDVHEMTEKETWLTGTETAEKFDVELLEPLQTVNCFGTADKLKAMGAKNIPLSLNFMPENKKNATKLPVVDDWAEVEIALAIGKGVV